jgi:tetratricopeptide (TPR) repeat protein
MKKNKNSDQINYTRGRKLLYNTILIIIPLFIFFLLEMVLRIINYGDNYSLFRDFPEKDFQEYRYTNPVIGKKYFQKVKYNTPCGDMFLKEKPENGFRVFVLGSSTVLGFPYKQNLMFSRILQDRLQDCYPEKKIEVINTAITAVNSYTLLDFIDDVLKEEPDAILIYAGHNEFYGAFGVGSIEKTSRYRILTFLHLNLLSLRFYQLLQNAIAGVGELLSGKSAKQDVRGILMKVIVENKEIGYKGKIYNIGIENYRKNIDHLLKKVKRKNVPVFISDLVSNIKDLKPFCSVETTDYPKAIDIYNNGVKSEREGNFEMAKEYYYRAKDLDCIRFRASEEINEIIQELALKYDAYLVPMKSRYEEASANKLIGNNLLTEHVHPNIDGYFLMADAFFNEMTKSKIIGKKLSPVYYKNSSYYKKNWGYTKLDSLAGWHLVNIMRSYWPFKSFEATSAHYRNTYKPESLVDSLAFAVATSPSVKIDEAHLKMADFYKKRGDYYKAFREYYANIKYDPFQVRDYNEAVHCLSLIYDFPLALKLLNKSLELKESLYAYFVKSEILILKGDYDEAIQALNRASELDNSINTKVRGLITLHKIYYYSGDDIKSQEILEQLRKINLDYKPLFPEKKRYVDYIPIQVEEQINRALSYYRSGNFNAALAEFLRSLEDKETSIANRCMGDILFTRNDSSSIVYYLKAYPDYKNDINFLCNLGILYLQNSNPGKVKAVLEEMRSLDPDNNKISILEEKLLTLIQNNEY